MGLIVRARLRSGAYFVGDTLLCKIVVYDTDPAGPEEGAERRDLFSWVSVVVHGRLAADPSWVNLPALRQRKKPQQKTSPRSPSSATSLHSLSETGDNSDCIFITPAHVLGCDITAQPGQCRTFLCRMTLPTDIPPTIQGTGLRVNYWFTISAQRPNSKTFSCRLPFRVHHPAVFKRMKLQGWSCKEPPLVESMELEACSIPFADTTLPFQEEWEHERRTLTSPFYSPTFSSSSASPSPLASPLLLSGSGTDNHEGQYQQSLAAQELAAYFQTVAALRNELSVPETFNICKGRYHLCRVNITKRAFTFGDTIEGVIDFSSANIPCYQVSLLLQNLEEIDPSVVHPSRSNWRVRRTHGEHHHLTLNTRLLPFSFTLPLAATQELLSDILCVSWVLHFEFVTTPPPVDLQVVSSSATPKEEEEEIIKTTTTVTGDEAKDQHHLKPQPQDREKGKAMNYVIADSGQPKQPPKNIVQVVVARTPQQGEVTRWDLALRLLCWERQHQSSHGNSLLGRSPGGEVFSDLRQ